jgi:TfoX/Sxy family transcriptional regulator of competence genes
MGSSVVTAVPTRRRAPVSDRWSATGTIAAVAYDETLADRIRDLLGDEHAVTERKMFGGLAFLVAGNMAISASGQGGILVRVDPEESDRLVATSAAEVAVMRGRPMDGWLRVAPEQLRTKRQLNRWTSLGAAYARSLPPKH